MSKGLLSEQMGAMALVDELRHRRMEVEEHLDLPRREAEVAERIRAYYKGQGIDCDDALVAQGVREFFRHRLVFEAPAMTLWQRFLGRLISSTAFRCWMLFMLAFAVMFGMSFGVSFYHGFKRGFAQAVAPAAQPVVVVAPPAGGNVPAVVTGAQAEKNEARFEQLRSRMLAMPLSEGDLQRGQLEFATQSMYLPRGGQPLEQAFAKLQAMLAFIEPELQLYVANVPGLPTGVEVCPEPNSCEGKGWFIFLKAFDAQGRSVDFITPTSRYSGPTPAVVAGVEVSEAQYQRIKQAKLDNVRIDRERMGSSPAFSSRMEFGDRALDKYRTITQERLATVKVLDSF
ncbi:DUF6384 family protein [Pseudomonas putida]|uniref:Uncharacterized protein n=1 Tax=Pseudomonas putida TaxID=303 RepID=A0A1Q9QVH4_PSEPU|nr:DUF6384 family protein [Pseudomonas putida]OLS59154.1 hypothetical protein PSEMO_61150 [Pseudomonas putida]